jgi:NCAIR mutase (PurE)-related protein
MKVKLPYAQVGSTKIDLQRGQRCGFEEVIYAPGKTQEQLEKICLFFIRSQRPLILTRLEEKPFRTLKKDFPNLEYNRLAKVAFFLPRKNKGKKTLKNFVLVVSAGTSDIPVAEEAVVILGCLGLPVERLYDVGVAGLDRLLVHKQILQRSSIIIVVAGMDAALSSVVSGLVRCPVIAVPTSCGYGAHFKGLAPLLSMLNSCSAGVGVVNIDNGFGAAILAAKIMKCAR